MGITDLQPLAILFEQVGDVLENVKIKCAKFRPVILVIQMVLRPDLHANPL